MIGLQAKCKGTKLSYTQFSKMEGMLGKIKLTFQIYLFVFRLENKLEGFKREQCGKCSLELLKLCRLQQKNYNEAALEKIGLIGLGS